MKLILFLVISSWHSLLNAQCTNHCASYEAAHENFCQNLNRFSCEFHSNFCYVYKYCAPTPPQEPPRGFCYSYKAIHENFCGNLNRFSCEFHDSLCYWAY